VDDFVFVEMTETMDYLTHYLNCLVFGDVFTTFYVLVEVTTITIFHDEIEIIGSFFHIIQSDNISILTAFKDFNLAL
jgi:hypothetical protein